jgi:hypothetical protein
MPNKKPLVEPLCRLGPVNHIAGISRPPASTKKHRLKNRFICPISNGVLPQLFDIAGVPEEIRTPDPQIRSGETA